MQKGQCVVHIDWTPEQAAGGGGAYRSNARVSVAIPQAGASRIYLGGIERTPDGWVATSEPDVGPDGFSDGAETSIGVADIGSADDAVDWLVARWTKGWEYAEHTLRPGRRVPMTVSVRPN